MILVASPFSGVPRSLTFHLGREPLMCCSYTVNKDGIL